MLQIGRSLVRSQLVSLKFFFDIKSFRSHYGPGVDTHSNRNEYQYFLGSKGGRFVKLTTLPPSCAVVTKSGNLNFLESSGPLQACNGTFYLYLLLISVSLSQPQGHSAARRIMSTKNSDTIEPATLRLAAQCLDQLRHRAPQ